jgi:hypothetical protein
MTPKMIKEFWLTLASFNMANKRDYELYSRLIVDSFNRKDGTVTYKLALIMIKGMLQQAKPEMLDEFLGQCMARVSPMEQSRFVNQIAVASQLVITIEKCSDLYQDLVTSSPIPKSRGGHRQDGLRIAAHGIPLGPLRWAFFYSVDSLTFC